MEKEEWQFRNALSTEWATDHVAMSNPKFKSFDDYKNHVERLNKKFDTNVECRLKLLINK